MEWRQILTDLALVTLVLVGVAGSWTKFLKPIVLSVRRISEVIDVLKEIAEEYKPDDGTSLKDVISSLRDKTEESFELHKKNLQLSRETKVVIEEHMASSEERDQLLKQSSEEISLAKQERAEIRIAFDNLQQQLENGIIHD